MFEWKILSGDFKSIFGQKKGMVPFYWKQQLLSIAISWNDVDFTAVLPEIKPILIYLHTYYFLITFCFFHEYDEFCCSA